MKIIEKLLLKYKKFRDEITAAEEEAEIRAEEKRKKYYLDNYGTYRNADELTHEEMLKVFWKILEKDYYNTSGFNSDTNVREMAKQDRDWGDNFLIIIDKMFGFAADDISDKEYESVETFGELADLVIKKAKEKKLKEQAQ